jgi:hypothetical protein
MTAAQRTKEIRLHVDDKGIVWYAAPGKEAEKSSIDAQTFVKQGSIDSVDTVRVLGSTNNTQLICELYRRCCVLKSSQAIQLGNPGWVPKTYKHANSILLKLASVDELPPSLGGWRTMGEKDYMTYALCQALLAGAMQHTSTVERFLQVHPAWPAISFIAGVDKASAAKLIFTMLDPRWYVNPKKPERVSGLRGFLGLGAGAEGRVARIISGEEPTSLPAIHAKIVLDTWTGGNYGMLDYEKDDDVMGPGGFLRRAQLAAKDKGPVKALLRTSQLFLRFLSEVWVDNMFEPVTFESVVRQLGRGPIKTPQQTVRRARPRKSGIGNYELFVPEHFFKGDQPTELAWRSHLRRVHGHAD